MKTYMHPYEAGAIIVGRQTGRTGWEEVEEVSVPEAIRRWPFLADRIVPDLHDRADLFLAVLTCSWRTGRLVRDIFGEGYRVK